MSPAAIIAPELPYLRRYARALSGSQASGDAYVVAMLEMLIEDPSLLDRSLDSRMAIYKAFSSIWNAMPLNASAERPAFDTAAEKWLDGLTPLPRQAFLLTAVEGFSAEQAACVLAVNPDTFARLIEAASNEINAQVATSVLIIEDEPIIAMDLQLLVKSLGHGVADRARTRDEAVEMAERRRPGLILADVRLADGSSGIGAVHDILKSFEVPVVFITAYPEMVLTGERPEPAFVIAKPFEEDTVRAVISQALFFSDRGAKATATAA